MISWRNPTADDRDLGMDDYPRLGVHGGARRGRARSSRAPRSMRSAIVSAARCSRSPPPRWRATRRPSRCVTLLAAQTDFTEAGELTLFIDESQISSSRTSCGRKVISMQVRWPARSSSCDPTISSGRAWSANTSWARRSPMTDLMAWNADATRMPYRMHKEYLRRLFPEQRSVRRALCSGRPTDRAQRHPLADFRRLHGTRPCRAVALGLQDQSRCRC